MGLLPRGSIFASILVGVFVNRIYNKLVIHQQPLNKADFKHVDFTTPEVRHYFNNVFYVVTRELTGFHQIPTTYYSQGKIKDVLPDVSRSLLPHYPDINYR